ncbi:ATP-binding protein [Beggiatoa leptomitoformis]|uniref:histidine kinase n=1 Tax=Beggiatoa leptomitoformis TaxID=288004 RepID=A0A2N9YH44_9GAMM|nr:ATP-binding protein [Beggiatoa leptomitoformis]ALG67861.1 response regulator [Beggiatoa leptomitoformis]AUI69881.1 response regulator [Beggiatoa leptomitoformis]
MSNIIHFAQQTTNRILAVFPLRVVLIVPFLAQLIITVGLVAWLSFANGQKAVQELSQALRSEITQKIQQNLADYLSVPFYVVKNNLALLNQHFLTASDLTKWEKLFREQIYTYKTINSIALANEQKEFVAIRRIEASKLSFALSNEKTNFNLINYDYYTNQEIARSDNFDPRSRSWYKNPVKYNGLRWSDIFIALDTTALQLTVGVPITNVQAQLSGVIASTLRLTYISDFLKNLKIGKTGQTFIIERNGMLVASSTGENLFKKEDNTTKRMAVTESTNALTRYIADVLLQRFTQLSTIQTEQQIDFVWSDARYFLQVTPYQDDYGLDWLIVVLIPEADFMAQIHTNTRVTFVLSLLALIIAIFVGLLTARWVIKPILELNHAAQNLANGQWQAQSLLQTQRQDELGQLANSFQRMADQLYISFKNLENEVVARTQAQASAEAANRAKSTFLATMSHELRTPLNGILGYTQILEDDENLTLEQQEGIKTIQRSGEYLLTLINDILDLTKIEANRLELYPSSFKLKQFLEELVIFFKTNAQQKNVTFLYEALTLLPRFICTDEKRLRQVLINLLSNAVKFTARGGITFRVSYLDEKLCFQIEDTGVGISPEDLIHICESFKQVGDPKYRPDGTGLGLSITKRLLALLGGELLINSELGKGSCFSFCLHLSEIVELEKPTETPLAIGYTGTPRKILVIDDHWENRALLNSLLKPLGFEMIEAVNGADGLEKAKYYIPDLIVTDFVMPVMDGFEVVRQLRKIPALKNIPIIADSMSLLDYPQNTVSNIEINAFLPKPIKIEILLAILEKQLALTWIYKKPQGILSENVEQNATQYIDKTIILPSPTMLRSLHELATMGHINGIFKQLNHLETMDKQFSPFVKQIHVLAKGFQLDEICALIEQYLQQ